MRKYLHISPSIIDSLCPGANDVQIGVLQAYLSVRDSDLQRLDEAVLNGLIEQQQQYAHRMKSQFKLLGADDAALLCQQLEQPGEKSIEELAALLEEVVHIEQLVAAEVSDLIIELSRD